MKESNQKLIRILLILIIIVIGTLFAKYLNLFTLIKQLFIALIPFYIGFFLCWLLTPFAQFLNKKFKIKIWIANTLAIIISIIVILIILLVLLPYAFLQMVSLANQFPETWNSFLTQINIISTNINNVIGTPFIPVQNSNDNKEINEFLNTYFQNINYQDLIKYLSSSVSAVSSVVTYIINIIKNITKFITSIIFGYIIAIYFMGSIKGFVKKTVNLFSGEKSSKYQKMIIEMSKTLFAYLRGILFDCTLVSVEMTIGAALIGIPAPLVFGLISGFTNFIPYVGPIIGGVPLVIVALSLGMNQAILVVLLICVVQFTEAYIIQPKIMAKATSLHPVSIMVGMLIFSTLIGPIGLIMATPLMAMIKIGIKYSPLKDKITL